MHVSIESVNEALSLSVDRKTREKVCRLIALNEWERRIKQTKEDLDVQYTRAAVAYHQDWKKDQRDRLRGVELEIEGIKAGLGI